MSKMLTLYTMLVGILGVMFFGYNLIDSLDRCNIELVFLFSLLITLSGAIAKLSFDEFRAK